MIGSAYWIAAARARESERDDRLFDDPYADALAGDRGRTILAVSERATGGENPFLPVRTRFIDDAIAAELDAGASQVVLLGAGLDTRPYRLALSSGVDWYELDRPEIFAEKQRVLDAAGAVPRCRRITVPVDLTGDWLSPLHAAGFDEDRRTIWIAEGLVFYLAPGAVHALLRTAAQAAAVGSALVADVMSETGLRRPAMDAYRRYAADTGRPPPFGHDDPSALLVAAGWMIDTLTWAGAPDANFGRFPHQLPAGSVLDRPGERAHLIVARRGPDRPW